MSQDTFARADNSAANLVSPAAMGSDFVYLASLAKIAQIDAQIDEIILAGPFQYNGYQLAEKAGISLEMVENFVRWFGRPAISLSEVRYNDTDVEIVKYAMKFAEKEKLDSDDLGSMVRSVASGLYRLALRQVEAVVQMVAETENVNDTEARLIAAEIAPRMAESLLPLVDHIWRRQYATVVHRLTTSAIAQRGLQDDNQDFPLLRAVGFADLVSFTSRTKNLTAREFADLIRDFHDACWDIVTSRGGRIVNFIGDSVFFLADDVPTATNIALALSAQGETGMCGPVRVGMVWARVFAANGDIFGPAVNLASRITRAAGPGDVFIGPAAAARLAGIPGYSVVPQTPFDARGIGMVTPSRVRFSDDPRNSGTDDAGAVTGASVTGPAGSVDYPIDVSEMLDAEKF